ncbi:MAG TPA: putative sugar nucleotidyl transferase, partial [bacterium]|nr:putative sugar nucleotidyl transferase [bacterium]
HYFPGSQIFYQCRPLLASVYHEQFPDRKINNKIIGDCLFINGRVLMDGDLMKVLTAHTDGEFVSGGVTIAFWNSLKTTKIETKARIISYPWDLVKHNGECITSDFDSFKVNSHQGKIYAGAHLVNPDAIYIGAGSSVKPGVVLDAEKGPIIIGNHVDIMPNAVIEGPCFIGDHSIIKIGAKIYGQTTIGPVCKVGGEVEGSIIQGYSNKQHDGFLGHSYIGEWCNLGAGTNTSDLKNNYSSVRVTINGKDVDTGSMFVGLTMGDHSKSGINTMFNTGTVVGVCSNVFGGGFPPKDIPSYAWVDSPKISLYKMDKAMQVANTVMVRRKVLLGEKYNLLLQWIFEFAKDEQTRL